MENLDGYKSPLIGLEYIVEILPSKMREKPRYICLLCNKSCNSGILIEHVIGCPHRNKYVSKFPIINKILQGKIEVIENKTDKKRIMIAYLARIAQFLEQKFGRLHPYVEKEEQLETKKEFILNKILEDNHFKEITSEDITEMFGESKENVDVEPTDHEPSVRHLSELDLKLENFKHNPVVGLDYVVQLRDEEVYFCTLCEKQGSSNVIVSHLISRKHCLKFVNHHFPRTAGFLDSKFNGERRDMVKALKLICTNIETNYGRSSPVVMDRRMFELKKYDMITQIIDKKRFRDPLDERFIELINKHMTYSLPLQLCENPEFTMDDDSRVSIGIKMEVEDIVCEVEESESSEIKVKDRMMSREVAPHLQKMLKQLNGPTIGVEYLIELTSLSQRESKYMCALCDKIFDENVAKIHFTSQVHCSKYINIFFPAAKKAILLTLGTMKQCKKQISEMIMVLCGKIQERYGWLSPRTFDDTYFQYNRKNIIDEIATGEHLRETSEENFVEFVDKYLKEKEVNHNKFRDSTYSRSWFLPLPPPQPVIQYSMPEFRDSTYSRSWFLPLPPPPPPQPVIQYSMPGPQIIPAIHKISLMNLPRLAICTPPAAQGSPVSTQEILCSKKEAPVDLLSLKPKLHENSRSRSTNPFDIEFGRLSTVDESLKSTVKWEMYESKFKKLQEDIIKDISYYKMNPEKHPSYAVEWKKFWNNWYDRIKSRGLDPAKQNIMPEWIEFWSKKVKDLFKQKFESMKQDIKRTYGLNVLWKPVTEHHHEEEETHKDAGNKRRGKRNNSESPPPKQPKGFSKNKYLDRRSKEKTWEKEASKESHRRKSRERNRERKSRERSRERKSREKSRERKSRKKNRERKSREKSRERGFSRQETQRGKSRERTDDKESREKVQYRKSRKRESSVDRVRDKKSMERERKSREESQVFEKAETSLEKSRQKDVDKESNEENRFIKSAKINTGLVSVLRIAAALEDQLGSLGPQVNYLLGSALTLEKMAVSSSETLLANSEHFTFLETVKEKLRERLIAGIVNKSMVLAIENCVDLIEKVLIEAEKENAMLAISAHDENINSTAFKAGMLSRVAVVSDRREKIPDEQQAENLNSVTSAKTDLVSMPSDSTAMSKSENVNCSVSTERGSSVIEGAFSGTPIEESAAVPFVGKVAIAKDIIEFYSKQGKFDVSSEEVEELVKYVSKNKSSDCSTVEFLSQMQEQEKQENCPGTSSSAFDTSDFTDLPTEDLENLLRNYKILPTDEQNLLSKYLSIKAATCPEKVRKLLESQC